MTSTLTQISWNVNSIRLRIGHLAKVIDKLEPDVICLQEIKCQENAFPSKAFSELGYPNQAFRAGKSQGGVAIVSKHEISSSFSVDLGGKPDCRHVSANIMGVEFHNFYVPAGGYEADTTSNLKFVHKLQYLDDMEKWFLANRLNATTPMTLCGDLNVAPHEYDVWSHKEMLATVSHTTAETTRLNKVKDSINWSDVMRETAKEYEKIYTWWTYRQPDWKTANKGRRLDHIWLCPKLRKSYIKSDILIETRDWERPSDHVPICVSFAV